MNEIVRKEFNHLKIHTQYSICEGALKTLDLAKYCKVNKIKAIGLCDSNNLCGALEFSETIAKSKTQPIIGCVLDFAISSENSKAPHKLFESHKATALTLLSLQYFAKS